MTRAANAGLPKPLNGAAENGERVKVSTQQRVLDVSIDLFNHYGLEAVSIQQIAEALGISPGNLTYHYKKKSDLVAEHVSLMEDMIDQAIRNFKTSHDPHDLVSALDRLLRLTLRYRFLFVGANFILQHGLVGPARYAALISHTKRRVTAQIRRLISARVLRPIAPPHSLSLLVNSIWKLWLGAVLDAQIMPAGLRPNDDTMIADIAISILFLARPYTDEPFFAEAYAELAAQRRQAPPGHKAAAEKQRRKPRLRATRFDDLGGTGGLTMPRIK